METIKKLSIKEAEELLNLSAEEWKGKCHEIAGKLISLGAIKGRAVYGHWIGHTSSKSFFSARRDMPFIQHGWIVTVDNTIIDPTRWVFEAVEPYIYYGGDAEDDVELFDYDEGGNVWRTATRTSPPEFNKKERTYTIVLAIEAHDLLGELLNISVGAKDVSLGQMFWLANLPLDFFGPYVKEIYQWIVNMGLVASIPMDNKIRILGV